MKLNWYFDFISPFAYLQLSQFSRLPEAVEIEFKPILFAGLLKAWNNVGPAEIAPKRIFTYKHCYSIAKKNNIPFTMPPAHPFNSLAALRLAIACQSNKKSIQIIFDTIWKAGRSLDDPKTLDLLSSELQLDNIQELIANPEVKDKLRSNSEEAIQNLVFGVPTFVTQDNNKEIFWGFDTFEMLLDYIEDPISYYDQEMLNIQQLPEGVQRRR